MLDLTISDHLATDDDAALWESSITTVLADISDSIRDVREQIIFQVGSGRHWIRRIHRDGPPTEALRGQPATIKRQPGIRCEPCRN